MLRGMMAVILSIGLTVICWGIYGPTIHVGQEAMEGTTKLRPFMCVGVAYFIIAVVVPVLLLRTRSEIGRWTTTGTIWSLVAGAVGALGALGIILAFSFRGSPIYVMPLVFGCAPVVNTFVTMFLAKNHKSPSPIFYSGLILVAVGAVVVMVFKPSTGGPESDPLMMGEKLMIGFSIAMTALCWGAYGPVLHKGQMKMDGSRLRPFVCVGLAYFVIAVILPGTLLGVMETEASFTFKGSLWSLIAGAAGAVGALGIIMAFNFGGKPIFVMPLVFGGAPVVNTFTSIISKGTVGEIGGPFYGGLIAVIAGAVTVLIFAPKPTPKPSAGPAQPESKPPDENFSNKTLTEKIDDAKEEASDKS